MAIAIRALFSMLCHHHSDRLLYLYGVSTAVCSRCLGIYAGGAVGGLIRLSHGVALRCLYAALALNCVDVAAESVDLHGNMPLVRLLIGMALGIAAGAMLSAESPSTKPPAQPDMPSGLH